VDGFDRRREGGRGSRVERVVRAWIRLRHPWLRYGRDSAGRRLKLKGWVARRAKLG
jgi:hypothetical protein